MNILDKKKGNENVPSRYLFLAQKQCNIPGFEPFVPKLTRENEIIKKGFCHGL